MREQHVCRECGSPRELSLLGWTEIGRPKWKCPEGHTQVGPFASRDPVAADGGEQV